MMLQVSAGKWIGQPIHILTARLEVIENLPESRFQLQLVRRVSAILHQEDQR